MSGLATRLFNAGTVVIPTEIGEKDFCACDFRCDFVEVAFSGTNEYNSDKTDFLFRKITSSDTIDLELHKNGSKVADITDDTYGTYYPSFSIQPNYIGFLADWTLIYAAFGYGTYNIVAQVSVLGGSFTFTSRAFECMLFDERIAHDTVKIETYQFGNIVGHEFQFKNLLENGWYGSIRLPGSFNMTGDYEEDRYLDSSYRLIQNREKTIRKYEVKLEMIPDDIHHKLISVGLLANFMRISGYDVFKKQEYRNIEVILDEIGEQTHVGYGKYNFDFTVKDRAEDNIKRNV